MLSGRCVCSRSGKATFSNTVMSVKSAPNWNSMLMRRRSAVEPVVVELVHVLARDADRGPPSGRSCPPISRSSVVLPQPLPPMIATTLPRGTRIEMPLRTGRRPYAKTSPTSTSTRVSGTREELG